MANKIPSILVVGGGTSGWITASMIKKAFGERITISLIESEDIGVIGVGEATVPTLRAILQNLGLDEADFMKHCQGTFKLGVKFVNWRKPQGQKLHHYYHAFGPMPEWDGVNLSEYWLYLQRKGWTVDFASSCYKNPWLCEAKKSPKFNDTPEYQGIVDYTYHVDAKLFAAYLRNFAKSWGVKHLVGNVLSVDLNSEGAIDCVKTDKHGELRADLFLDCTGFRGLLINQAMGEKFIPYSKSLLCDRAVTVLVPKNPKETGIQPYTTAHALKAGWVWNIPLQTRDGTGYVYSSSFVSDAEAEREFREFLGKDGEKGDVHAIKMRIGRNPHAWVKNCIAIGLSGGFIEPLESSGIGFIYIAVNHLLSLLEKHPQDPEKIAIFNDQIASVYDMIRDFIVLHYCLTDREDSPFWLANQKDLFLPDSFREHLEIWKSHFPKDHIQGGLFALYNYKITHVLAGMDHLPSHFDSKVQRKNDEEIEKKMRRQVNQAKDFAEELPDHFAYLHSKSPFVD